MDDIVGAAGEADSVARAEEGRHQHQQGCGGGEAGLDHLLVIIFD